MKEIVGRWYDIVENTPTFLSRNVQDLVLKKGIAETASSDASLKVATDDLLDISNVSSLLLSDDDHLLPPTQRNAEWYSKMIKDIAPFFAKIQRKMKAMPKQELKGLIKLCDWMHQPQIIELCFDLLTSKNEVSLNSHECLLLITAALERALGNLFLHRHRKRKVPSLFRDLLASPELLEILSLSQVYQNKYIKLMLLLGSPLSLNLRNLIWHGFVGFLDWDAHGYASVLLFICTSIGRHLDGCRSILSIDEIIPRRWATFKRHQQGRKWPKWSQFMVEEMLVEAVSRTRGLSCSRKAIWLRAIKYHQEGSYGRCCALMMPEIEHTLRLIYCAVNGCPARALTAESVVHYTTLDVILECSDESNKMAEFLGRGLYCALLDIFVRLEGPRVRDRFSHGECQLWDIDIQLSRHLLALSTAILWLADDEKVSCIPNYSPEYSPSALFHSELIQTIKAIEPWFCMVNVDQPVTDLSSWPAEWLPLINDWLHNWSTSVNYLLINHLEEENSRQMNDIVVIETNRCPLSATWRRMMNQIVLGSQRMTAHYNEKSSSCSNTLSSWSLRSRQRSTHARLDSYMCLFVRAVQLSLLFPIAVNCGGQVIVNHPLTVRRMKRNVNRWADNFASVNNRWTELAECAKESIQSMEILLASVVVFVPPKF